MGFGRAGKGCSAMLQLGMKSLGLHEVDELLEGILWVDDSRAAAVEFTLAGAGHEAVEALFGSNFVWHDGCVVRT
jgi:hypothetical protein